MSEDKFSTEGMDFEEHRKPYKKDDEIVISDEMVEEIDTLTSLDELTISINEVFRSYKRSGFNSEQAFELATIHLERALDMMDLEDIDE